MDNAPYQEPWDVGDDSYYKDSINVYETELEAWDAYRDGLNEHISEMQVLLANANHQINILR
jgi:hypothetical protein